MRTERSPVQGDPAGGRWPRATEGPGSPLLEGPAPCRGHCGPTRLALRWIWVQRYLARSPSGNAVCHQPPAGTGARGSDRQLLRPRARRPAGTSLEPLGRGSTPPAPRGCSGGRK